MPATVTGLYDRVRAGEQLHPTQDERLTAALLFPTVAPRASVARAEQCRSLAEADFFSTKTEDRYPDIFGLARAYSVTHDQAHAIARGFRTSGNGADRPRPSRIVPAMLKRCRRDNLRHCRSRRHL
ncbi:MAG: hypothetical protein ACRDRP_03225 [Pseudonocardiaceae bacterium]